MSKRKRYPKGNYQEIFLQALRAGLIDAPKGKVTHMDIYHDDDCGIFRGKPCDCDPDIIQRVRPKQECNQ